MKGIGNMLREILPGHVLCMLQTKRMKFLDVATMLKIG